MSRRYVLGVSVALALAACWLGSQPEESARAQGLPRPRVAPKYLGVGTCASVACHFQPEAVGAKGAEYTTWITHDRHAQAYLVLLTERSQRMVRNLYGSHAKPAQETALCLKCHAFDIPKAQRGPQFQLDEGVGCERCHGPANDWIAAHFRPGWAELSDEEKAKRGMRPLKNLEERVKLCTECHVGSPDMDVNHDLIAAGHPRLTFEFSSYQIIMPRHWSERDEKARYPDFEYRSWALGQAVAAESALELLAHRASDPHSDSKPWPEFAEYACFACHHDLKEKSWRQERGYGKRLPGSLPFSHWYTALLPRALDGLPVEQKQTFTTSLDELNAEMSKAAGDPGRIADKAKLCARNLRPLIEAIAHAKTMPASDVRASLESTVREGDKLVDQGWDEAAQLYLAIAAQYHALGDLDPALRDAKLRKDIRAIVKDSKLKFPKKGERYDSPRNFTPKAFHELLGDIQRQLKR